MGQANKALKHYKNWEESKDEEEFRLLLDELNAVHRVCLNIYNNPKINDGAKWELKVWEWQQYDFYFWGNKLRSSVNNVNRWIDQFMYDINYTLV